MNGKNKLVLPYTRLERLVSDKHSGPISKVRRKLCIINMALGPLVTTLHFLINYEQAKHKLVLEYIRLEKLACDKH
jgi:hypothetical protein